MQTTQNNTKLLTDSYISITTQQSVQQTTNPSLFPFRERDSSCTITTQRLWSKYANESQLTEENDKDRVPYCREIH